MLESAIESKIRDYAKLHGVISYKFTSPAQGGVPDRLFVFPGGRVAFLEIKAKGKEPTPLQKRELLTLRKQGAVASWCDSVESGCRLISQGAVGNFDTWKESSLQ